MLEDNSLPSLSLSLLLPLLLPAPSVCGVCGRVYFCVYVLLVMKLVSLHMLDKCSTNELHYKHLPLMFFTFLLNSFQITVNILSCIYHSPLPILPVFAFCMVVQMPQFHFQHAKQNIYLPFCIFLINNSTSSSYTWYLNFYVDYIALSNKLWPTKFCLHNRKWVFLLIQLYFILKGRE